MLALNSDKGFHLASVYKVTSEWGNKLSIDKEGQIFSEKLYLNFHIIDVVKAQCLWDVLIKFMKINVLAKTAVHGC